MEQWCNAHPYLLQIIGGIVGIGLGCIILIAFQAAMDDR